jgi:hypothetical protein
MKAKDVRCWSRASGVLAVALACPGCLTHVPRAPSVPLGSGPRGGPSALDTHVQRALLAIDCGRNHGGMP